MEASSRHTQSEPAGAPGRRARWTVPAVLLALTALLAVLPAAAELEVLESLDVAPVWAGHPVGFSVETAAGRQYVGFYDSERRMTVAARELGSAEWVFQRLPSRLGWDSHNAVVLATDRAGFIHVAGNMHGDPLVYFRSERPHDISTLRRVPMIGSQEREVTYPQFVRDASGELYFHYRDGRSGEGVRIFNRFDPAGRRWERYLDREVGVHIRRFCYFHLLERPDLVAYFFCYGQPAYWRPAFRAFYPALRRKLVDAYDIRPKHPLRFEHTRYCLDMTRGLRKHLGDDFINELETSRPLSTTAHNDEAAAKTPLKHSQPTTPRQYALSWLLKLSF